MEFVDFKIKEIAKVTAGGDKPKIVSNSYSDETPIPIYSNGMENDGLYGYTNIPKVDADTVTISARGVNVGKVCYRETAFLPIVRLLSLIPNRSVINAKYMYYNLKMMNISGTGSAQPQITVPMISELKMHIHKDLIEQEKIASFLSVLDEKIKNNNRINRNLSEQAQAYFDELFIQNASAEWKEGTLSDVGSIVAGGTPFKSNQEYYTDNGIAWITPKDLSVDKSVFISHGENDITELGLQKSSATMMPAGTVLFSSRAPIGYIAIAANDICTNQGFKSVVPNGNVGTSYVYYLLKQLLPTIENMASGSTFKEISGSAMKIVPTVIPDDETLKRFSDFCDPIMKQIWKNEQESKRLVELRDSLLPKLMSGDLDVSDLDI